MRTPRSPTGSMLGRRNEKIRNICAVHTPTPLMSVSDSITCSSLMLGRRAKSTLPLRCVLGQVAYIAKLLPRESGPPHLSHAQVLYGLRRERSACSFFQPTIDSAGGFGAQLLKDDGARQHFEAGIAVGHLAGAYPGDNRGKNYIRFL